MEIHADRARRRADAHRDDRHNQFHSELRREEVPHTRSEAPLKTTSPDSCFCILNRAGPLGAVVAGRQAQTARRPGQHQARGGGVAAQPSERGGGHQFSSCFGGMGSPRRCASSSRSISRKTSSKETSAVCVRRSLTEALHSVNACSQTRSVSSASGVSFLSSQRSSCSQQ